MSLSPCLLVGVRSFTKTRVSASLRCVPVTMSRLLLIFFFLLVFKFITESSLFFFFFFHQKPRFCPTLPVLYPSPSTHFISIMHLSIGFCSCSFTDEYFLCKQEDCHIPATQVTHWPACCSYVDAVTLFPVAAALSACVFFFFSK